MSFIDFMDSTFLHSSTLLSSSHILLFLRPPDTVTTSQDLQTFDLKVYQDTSGPSNIVRESSKVLTKNPKVILSDMYEENGTFHTLY